MVPGEMLHNSKTVFIFKEIAKMIKVKYLIVDSPWLYNIIIGRPSFNLIWDALSTLYLNMKYPLSNGHIGII